LCAAASAGALDFGLAAGQELKISRETGDAALSYAPVLSPWASGPLGESFYLHLSGKAAFEYARPLGKDGAWREPAVLPELERSELTWRAAPGLSFSLGRQRYQDPSGLAASGLFDGLSGGFSVRGARLSAGVWYTGFLYKDAADIMITRRDAENHAEPFALDGTYFASRRALVSLDWEHPGLGPRSSLALGFLGQFDVNEGEERFHSQYLSARYGLRLPAGAGLEGTAVVGAGEDGGGAGVFFAAALEGFWALPGGPDDRLSLRALYSSPAEGERLLAFAPVNALPQGKVYAPAPGSLALIRGAYAFRPWRLLNLTAEYTCFIRTGITSFQDNGEPEKLKDSGYVLGGEVYGTAAAALLPDLAVLIGGGAFFPRLGDAFEAGASIRWKAALGLVLSL
jgi:hypothetical protein